MTPEQLQTLLLLGEGQTTEFKRAPSEDFSWEMVAFANSIGGTIVIGIDDKGKIIGVEYSNKVKAQIQSTARNLDPPLRISIDVVGTVLVVTVPQSTDRPHSSSGRFYIREVASCQQMTRSQIREYFFKEGMLLFDTMINPDFNLSKDLRKNAYNAFAKTAGIPAKLDMNDALQNLKLLTDKGMTNAGALVLGNHGSRFLISATVMCALFQGTTKTKILDQKLFDDDIVSNYRNALLYLQSHLNTEYIITSVRTNKLELPEEALREAIINAIAHRDYRNPANIQIFIFYDRVEIHNPGGLVAGLKLSELGKRSVPRNPLLFGILYRMDLVEHIGSGLKRIRDSMTDYGLEEPVIEADEHWFSVTFKRIGGEKGGEKGGENRAGSTKSLILSKVKEKPETTIAEIAKKLSIGEKRVERHVAELKLNAFIRRIGPDKGGHWEVIVKQ